MSGLVDENTNVSPNCRSPPAAPAAPAYYSINPALFDSKEYWSYRCAKILSSSLPFEASQKAHGHDERVDWAHRRNLREKTLNKIKKIAAVQQEKETRAAFKALTAPL